MPRKRDPSLTASMNQIHMTNFYSILEVDPHENRQLNLNVIIKEIERSGGV